MSTDPGPAVAAIEAIFREEYGRVVAALARRFGDLDLAEDMAQEAFVEALRRWPTEGTPPNPGGWLTLTARNRGIDRLRREATRDDRHQEAHMLGATDAPPPDPLGLDTAESSLTDERLRLLFTCCHPALATDNQIALTLRLLGGLSVAEVADAFLLPERRMAQRITRSKAKIKAARIPFRIPGDAELPSRLRGVLATVYLIFNEGYLPTSGASAIRTDLCAEAIRLGRVLRTLMPDDAEVTGLLALMLLIDARRAARVRDGVLITLDHQDRTLWNRELIAEGHDLVRACLRRGRPGVYQLQAAINAVQTDADRPEDVDWAQILALYDHLYAIAPTPVVALNRAVALAEVGEPAAALAVVDELDLAAYPPFHVTRAELLRRLDRTVEARAAYDAALAVIANPAERALLETRRRELG